MNDWMNGVIKWMYEWMNEWMKDSMNGVNKWMNDWMNGVNKWMNESFHWTNTWDETDVCLRTAENIKYGCERVLGEGAHCRMIWYMCSVGLYWCALGI